ncbi:HupE/UreJ family protein [Paenibacillus sp. S28]|uniref:HupE/UreJ family protein n=1 Tax=Paenibacillus sp. S28 TaxID=2767463 RepID=UPI00190C6574|nr:HupE/UreJ family protein [Paenibacillus sp. S28]MBJ9988854.1 HupE/UreJ family protein [Paenibacillus sp. S28]
MPIQWFRKLAPLILMFGLFFGGVTPVFAHDMYLGGSEWAVGKDRILFTIDLDPAILQQINGIKELGDNLDSLTDEQRRKMETDIVQPYMNEKLSVSVNDRSYPVKVEKMEKEGTVWRTWMKVSDLSLNQQDNKVKINYHLLFKETNNQHVSIGYIYFTDADDDSVKNVFNYSQPDLMYTFDSGHTEFEFSVKSKAAALQSQIFTFLVLGIKHILTGYDHITFLVALIVIGLSTREALKIITSFTLAHSITLLLAAMHVINLNSRFVESVIALSICYIALENLFAKQVNYRWLITFVFGLVHGFGFASALEELVRGKSNLVLSVVSFNVGVEAGQLMIFLILMPLLYLIRKKFSIRRVAAVASVAIFIVGFLWFVDRVFNLQLIPF